MVLVDGEYCPEVEQKCLEWMDPPSSRYHECRCARYEKPAKCKGSKVHKRYCIDATERTEAETNLPRHFMSWTSSKKLCEAEGARLCLESEWVFACEGERHDRDGSDPRLRSYVDRGGRAFLSHWSYLGVDDNAPFNTPADWGGPHGTAKRSIRPCDASFFSIAGFDASHSFLAAG